MWDDDDDDDDNNNNNNNNNNDNDNNNVVVCRGPTYLWLNLNYPAPLLFPPILHITL